MQYCNKNHTPIQWDDGPCPLCKAIKDLEDEKFVPMDMNFICDDPEVDELIDSINRHTRQIRKAKEVR